MKRTLSMSDEGYAIYQYYTRSLLGRDKSDSLPPCICSKDCAVNVNMNLEHRDPEPNYTEEPSSEKFMGIEDNNNDDMRKGRATGDVRPVCLQEQSEYPDFEQSVAVRFLEYLSGEIEADEVCSGRLFLDTELSVAVRFIDYLAGKIQADEVCSGEFLDRPTAPSLYDSIPENSNKGLIIRDHLMHLQKKFTKRFCDFEEFLMKLVPSNLKRHGWIVLAPGDVLFQEEFINFSDACKEWERLMEQNARVNFPLIRNFATKHNIFSGKWMIFRGGVHADLTWIRVARAHREGKLGVAARISLIKEDGEMNQINHVIFVYNDDFRDRKAVFELESKLRDIGIRCRMLYKPLVFTYCDIFSQNEWGMKPYIYMSTYDVKITQSTIIKIYDYAYDCSDDDDDGDDDDDEKGKHDGGNNQ